MGLIFKYLLLVIAVIAVSCLQNKAKNQMRTETGCGPCIPCGRDADCASSWIWRRCRTGADGCRCCTA